MQILLESSASTGSLQEDRAELLRLLLQDGILRRTSTQPVLSRDGTSARWMLDSLSVSMRPRGAELAGRCLLSLLRKFEGRQIATYGLTGVPLMQSAIVQSGGRYHGLIIRKEKKQHGSLKRIEGQIDLDEPTILIDDSISSGYSMTEGLQHLQEAGVWVEGGVALVRFGWDAGFAEMQARGLHMEAVYDVWEDLMENMADEPKTIRNPTKHCAEFPWSEKRAPEGLHPAHLARLAMEECLRTGKLPRPPRRLDAEYDSAGGAWVSLRDKDEIYYRHARDGFWNFPGEPAMATPEALLRAAYQTASSLGKEKQALATLARSHIAVTFFTALEECTPGQLDNDRYGIVVCSRERPSQMGGALPRMPGIGNEWEQFRHAWRKNAQLLPFEPYRIYRHDVRKLVEPGAPWQPTGVPASPGTCWHTDSGIGGRIAQRAREIVLEKVWGLPKRQLPLPQALCPAELHSLYITIYLDGALRGCAGSAIEDLERDLDLLVETALQDGRFAAGKTKPTEIAVSASLLFDLLELGEMSPEEVRPRFQLGRQALAVYQEQRSGMLLPFVAVTHNLDREGFVAEVVDKAGITRAPYNWQRFECSTWLADHHGVDLLEHGFRKQRSSFDFQQEVREMAEAHASYIAHNQRKDGSLWFSYEPFQNWISAGGGAPRSVYAAWVLMRAARMLRREDLQAATDRLLNFHLRFLKKDKSSWWLEEEDSPASVSELSFLLLTLCELPEEDVRRKRAASIATALWSRIDRHGKTATHRDPAESSDEFQDYFPGQMLLALAEAARGGVMATDQQKLKRALRFYRHRFRYKRNPGQVSWMMQAARGWFRATGDAEWSNLAFEIGDWIRTFQLDKNGGFITDHQSDPPGYTTAVYLEGLSAGASLAAEIGDHRRQREYLQACENGVRFLRTLVVHPEHESVLPNPAFALGGLRASQTSSEMRTDFAQHSLAALLELQSILGMVKPSPLQNRRTRARSTTS